MRVVWTAAALSDLDEALDYTKRHFPQSLHSLERRIRATVERVARWPESARRVEGRSDVRVVPLVRYPYRLFYRVRGDRIEILHVHHAARLTWGS